MFYKKINLNFVVKDLLYLTICGIFLMSIPSYANNNLNSDIISETQYKLVSKKHFINDFVPINENGTVNVVIEIPSGTLEKWEISNISGDILWGFKNGKPRKVQYLGYPFNYGAIPRTLLSINDGGDGDPLDAILIGPPFKRGEVKSGKVVGVLKLIDDGEKDDKILIVHPSSPLYKVKDINNLISNFPGVLTIIEIWFGNYKGMGVIKTNGYDNKKNAMFILSSAIRSFQNHQLKK